MTKFAFLSPDIIYDVLQFAHFERLSGKSSFINCIGGRWGEIAVKYRYSKLRDNKMEEYELDGYSESLFSAKNRKDVSVNSIRLSEMSDFTEIHHLLGDAYESPDIHYKGVPNKLLEKLGNRFTTICWVDREISCHNKCKSVYVTDVDFKEWSKIRRANGRRQLLPSDRVWVPMNGEIDFLKRQLKSPHLRILKSNNPLLARPEFIDLLADFVRKKNFETLKSTAMQRLSPEIFVAAYEAWLQRKEGEHLSSSVSAWISTEDLRKLTAGIPFARKKHPIVNHYDMLKTYNGCTHDNTARELTLEFSRNKMNN